MALCCSAEGGRPPGQAAVDSLPLSPQGTFSLIIEALHTDSLDDLTTGGWQPEKGSGTQRLARRPTVASFMSIAQTTHNKSD